MNPNTSLIISLLTKIDKDNQEIKKRLLQIEGRLITSEALADDTHDIVLQQLAIALYNRE